MTTNSPNPVDGDVQALIADCKSEIKHLEDRIAYCNKYGVGLSDYESQLKRQKIALAALMAVPLASTEKNEISNMQATGMYLRAWPVDREENERDGFNIHLYTTPSAQLLRTVELPESQRLCNGYYFDMNDVFESLEEAGVPFKVKS